MHGKIYHLNDRTSKYQTFAQTKRQHQYLGLPGKFKRRIPQEIIFPNMVSGRADEYYYNDEDLLVNFEEESGPITLYTLNKFSKYIIFASYWHFDRKPYLAVLCHQDPGKSEEFFEYGPSLYIKAHYIYIDQDTLWKKYDNLIRKVEQKKELTEMESLDMAFVCKFISKKYAPYVTERLSRIYKDAIIEDKLLKMDVGVILGGMILKNIKEINKQNKLLEMINMRHIENEIDQLVYDEYGDKLDAKDREIEEKNKLIETQSKELETQTQKLKTQSKELETQTQKLKTQSKELKTVHKNNKEFKEKISQLSKIKDLNSPKAKQIINSLTQL